MGTIPERVPVVCVLVGHRYPGDYVTKLESMLQRHMPVPFDLWCAIDRPRPLPPSVRKIDASGWGMRAEGMRVTTDKLRLFDADAMPFPEFLYLDATLVIQRDMGDLLDYAFGRPEELVVVQDWSYDAYNTCVMRIRPGGDLAAVPRAFREGKRYDQRNPGDQDFVTAYVREQGMENRVALWRPDDVVSYRNARRRHRTDPEGAYEDLRRGTIVKFYGSPKMHEILNPLYRFRLNLFGGKEGRADASFWVRELAERWR